jgi:hypothetical protein
MPPLGFEGVIVRPSAFVVLVSKFRRVCKKLFELLV